LRSLLYPLRHLGTNNDWDRFYPQNLLESLCTFCCSINIFLKGSNGSGLPVTCDVALHNLLYSDEALQDYDTVYKVNPPLRSPADIKALVKGLQDGTIDAIVSSHQPQDEESKKLEFDLAAYGMNNLQVVLPLLVQLLPLLPQLFPLLPDQSEQLIYLSRQLQQFSGKNKLTQLF